MRKEMFGRLNRYSLTITIYYAAYLINELRSAEVVFSDLTAAALFVSLYSASDVFFSLN